ncbi:MAG TPA: glycosyltransferase, partial [Nitrospira sp.]|nr:glycosyltransferase [Nitrospira sp.]
MKVLHVTPTFWPATYWGGPIFSTLGLCNALAALPEVELRVLTTDAAGPSIGQRISASGFPTQYPAGYEVFYMRRLMGQNVAPGLWIRLWSMVRWADVVHLTGVYSFSTIPTLLVCRILGKPVVWSLRGGLQRWKGGRRRLAKALWELVCWALAPSSLVLHATSPEEAQAARSRVPYVRAVVISNGVIIPNESAQRDPGDPFQLVYLGRLHPIKAIENLLEACRLLNRNFFRSWSLTVAGTGNPKYQDSLRHLVAALGLSEQVRFVGEITGNDKARLFDRADILLLPSHSENFGLAVTEALAHGVPVIASTGTPWKELEEKRCGLWTDNNPEHLAGAIVRIREMPLREMGQRGREWMQRDYAWASKSREMVALYEHMVGQTERPTGVDL